MLQPVTHKEKAFEYEKELRAATLIPTDPKDGSPLINDGIFRSVNLQILIESVYLAPKSSNSFREFVNSTMRQYGLTKEIHQSRLDDIPAY